MAQDGEIVGLKMQKNRHDRKEQVELEVIGPLVPPYGPHSSFASTLSWAFS